MNEYELPKATQDAMKATGEAVTELFAEFGRRVAAFSAALGPALTRWSEWADSPEGQMAIAVARAESAMPRCHCFCGIKHRSKPGICQGTAITEALVTTARFGDAWIPLCTACATEWRRA